MVRTTLLVLMLLAGADQAPHTRPPHHATAKQGGAESAKQDSTKPPMPIAHATHSADERLADYTRMLTWFTGGLFVATLLLWLTTRGTLQHLRREFEAEHRPWIPPDIQLASGWTWTPDGEGHVTLRFTLRNIGRSPATNVDIRTQIFPHGWGFPTPQEAQQGLSQSERRGPVAPGEGFGLTLFPGVTPHYRDISMSISAADLEKSRVAFKEKFPEETFVAITPIIVGCISYRFIDGAETHQSGFILQLHRTDSGHPGIIFVLDRAQGDIPIERLRLANYEIRSAVTD